MVDKVSPETRSRMMSKVKGKNTRLEMRVRRALHASGYRFRLHRRDLPGTPDIVLPKYRVTIFVHGCFWHQHGCARSRRPASNRNFWDAKLDRNITRDKESQRALEQVGWTPLTIWECELDRGVEKLLATLHASSGSMEP